MAWFLLLAALLTSNPSSATARAEALTRRAIVEYNGGDFDEALADAQKAYGIRPAADLLFNVGQCQRALHRWEEAADSFSAYLRERPKAPNRSTVEALILEMDRNQRDEKRPARPFPSASNAPSTPPDAVPTPAPDPTRVSATPPPPLRIAVLDVQAHGGVSDDLAQAATSVLVLDVRKRAVDSTVVGSDEIRAVLGLVRGKRLLECTGGSCLGEIGEALRADRFVLGSLTRLGKTYLLDVQLVDGSATVLANGSARFKQEGAVPEAVAQSVQALFSK